VITPVPFASARADHARREGRVRFTIGGDTRIASAGDVLCFSVCIEHGATDTRREVVLVDIFTPLREEFSSMILDASGWTARRRS